MTDFSIANWNGWVDGWMGGIRSKASCVGHYANEPRAGHEPLELDDSAFDIVMLWSVTKLR